MDHGNKEVIRQRMVLYQLKTMEKRWILQYSLKTANHVIILEKKALGYKQFLLEHNYAINYKKLCVSMESLRNVRIFNRSII